jgi:hypothetical protein
MIGRGEHPARSSSSTISDARAKDWTHVEHRELGEDCAELLVEGVLRELDLAHVKVTDATDLEVLVDDLNDPFNIALLQAEQRVRTVGVFRCVFDRTMSRKSVAVGTGAICLRPLVDILAKAEVPGQV